MHHTDAIGVVRETKPVLSHEIQRDDLSKAKKRLNNLVWMYAPESISLGKAEAIAQDCLLLILEGKTVEELAKSRVTPQPGSS